jgi:hypothetical protein
MSIELFEHVPSLFPSEFFAITSPVFFTKAPPSSRAMRKSFLLPELSDLLGEEKFAEVALCWNEEGLYLEAFVDKPLEEVHFPAFEKGDALEVFIDTRDLKTAGFATRFCHHFLFLPQAVQGIQAQEMTHFRTEDTHPLCDPSELKVEAHLEKRKYSLRIFIPAQCLHGFDPHTFQKLGFTYRLHRFGGAPQHFAVSSSHFPIEQSPRLWASLSMKRK